MSVNINDILEELYALDPDLRQKESEIQKIIERMIKNRPEIQIDESFRNELRHKIMLEIEREMGRQMHQNTGGAGCPSQEPSASVW